MEGDRILVLIIPAIDIKNGEAVRLYKGDYNNKTVYSNKPEDIAKKFENMGAQFIHIVDLDGAKVGECTNLNVIKKIKESVNIPIELGGGIRDSESVELYLEKIGIDRIILGTIAVKNKNFLEEMLKKYGSERIIVGVDVKDGYVSVDGWLNTSKLEYIEFIKYLEEIGIKYIIVTDISKDGTLTGPNFKLYSEIKENSNINFVVSGGIKDRNDIVELLNLDYYGCIVGKAYYEGKLDLMEVIECSKKE